MLYAGRECKRCGVDRWWSWIPPPPSTTGLFIRVSRCMGFMQSLPRPIPWFNESCRTPLSAWGYGNFHDTYFSFRTKCNKCYEGKIPPPLLLKPISVLCPTSVLELNQVRVEYINKKYIYYSTLHKIYIFVYLLILYIRCVCIYTNLNL